MQSATKGNTTWTYTYNADGLRTGKTNGTTTYTYTWNDGKLTSQTWGNSYMLFYYNAEGKPLYVEYHDANDECSGTYYYVLNLQGDTVALYDPARNITAVNYEYDAWGRELSWSTYDSGYAGLIFNNPLTYRGYIYDSETGFYYLQSRYYDPTIGRFLNADDTNFLGVSETEFYWNLFVFCENSPVNRSDGLGYASYSNSYKNENVTTHIRFWWTKLTYNYIVKRGIIKFNFNQNGFWSVLWRGGAKTLAEAMYYAGKNFDRKNLQGRTISGIYTELFVHWALYRLGIKPQRTECADMGGLCDPGYDSNAWVFESASIIRRVSSISIYNLWAYASFFRDLARYF